MSPLVRQAKTKDLPVRKKTGSLAKKRRDSTLSKVLATFAVVGLPLATGTFIYFWNDYRYLASGSETLRTVSLAKDSLDQSQALINAAIADLVRVSSQSVYAPSAHLKLERAKALQAQLDDAKSEALQAQLAEAKRQRVSSDQKALQAVRSFLAKWNLKTQSIDSLDTLFSRSMDLLRSIKSDSPSYSEANSLRKILTQKNAELSRIKERNQRQLAAIREQMLSGSRKELASSLDEVFLKMGLDVSINVSGRNNTTIVFYNVLFSRPLIHRFQTETPLFETLRDAGFKRIEFTDGDRRWWWTYD